jgi:hypothetical protein
MVAAIVLATCLVLGARKQEGKWEYARLQYYGQGLTHRWSWIEPGVLAEGSSADELCNKLAIKTTRNRADAYEIVSWAGSNGWELTTMGSASLEYTAAIWLKRAK